MSFRPSPAGLAGALLLALGWSGGAPSTARSEATEFRLPIDDYPLDDNCLGFGAPNANFPRCGAPGLHLADDACAPDGTTSWTIADGVIRFGAEVGSCSNNWGWVIVVEHTLPGGEPVCSVYGHCKPRAGMVPGTSVPIGTPMAVVNYACPGDHLHFAIYRGAYGAADGVYPDWLLGYLSATACQQFPVAFPGNWVDPVPFVMERVAVSSTTWSGLKALHR